MEQIKNLATQDLPGVVLPTWNIYAPLLNANAAAITSTPAQTYSYGSHERQKLDLYTSPKTSPERSKHKVLVFVYGGGFIQGDRILPLPAFNKLAYASLGAFFASNYGFSVVVPDYRRINDAGEPKFPSGGEDLEKTLDWIAQNPDKLGAPVGSEIEIYIIGNSAGGAHTATFLLHPDFKTTRQKLTAGGAGQPNLRGIIFLSVPFQFPPHLASIIGSYFGPEPDALAKNSPLGLLRSLDVSGPTPEFIAAGVPTLLLTAELDSQEFHTSRDNFSTEWKEKLQANPGNKARLDIASIKGHNHISPPLALATGISEEEEWGRKVAEWIAEN
ncbi:unnamed protein product [Cercospora beticola]|nr:unnamed protein product [Cercospora beticola]